MPDHRTPPPPPPACLVRPYPSSQKGGTLIAADVRDPETHRGRLASGGYRPRECKRCGRGPEATVLLDAADVPGLGAHVSVCRPRCERGRVPRSAPVSADSALRPAPRAATACSLGTDVMLTVGPRPTTVPP